MGKDMIMNQNERLDYLAEQFKQPDGYRETIERGIAGVQRFRDGLTEGDLSRVHHRQERGHGRLSHCE